MSAETATAETPLLEPVDAGTITLKSKDGQSFVVEKASVMKQSATIAEIIRLLQPDEVPLLEVPTKELKLVVAFMELHKDSPTYVPREGSNCTIAAEDEDFLKNVEDDDLIALLNCSNYLNIPRLSDAGLLKIRKKIEGKTAEEIRRILVLPDDYTQTEKKELREKYTFDEEFY